jgi:hypothetical protein
VRPRFAVAKQRTRPVLAVFRLDVLKSAVDIDDRFSPGARRNQVYLALGFFL